jgi:hypothetical protein
MFKHVFLDSLVDLLLLGIPTCIPDHRDPVDQIITIASIVLHDVLRRPVLEACELPPRDERQQSPDKED